MSDIPESAPQSCPGTNSNVAGKASGCTGCPNQAACAAGPKEPDPDISLIRSRLSGVGHVILILSGKGGVGKSTVTAMLGQALAEQFKGEGHFAGGKQVAILDVDICGPSQPTIMGVENEQVHQSGSGWSPIFPDENLALMSIGFLLRSKDDAIIWRGPRKNGMIKQFLRDVDWNELDYLLVDTPPGTSDEHLTIVQYLQSCTNFDGAILVTTPQEVSVQDVRKEFNFCKKVSLPILGVVENMKGFICPRCTKESEIFPSSGGCQKLCEDFGLRLLGQVPLDPRVARCCDEGEFFVRKFPDSLAASACKQIVRNITNIIETNSASLMDSL